MSEHPQSGAIRRTIEDLKSLAGAADANGDLEVAYLLRQAVQCADMAVHRLNGQTDERRFRRILRYLADVVDGTEPQPKRR